MSTTIMKLIIAVSTLALVLIDSAYGLEQSRCGSSVLNRSGSEEDARLECCGSTIYDKTKSMCCGGATVLPLNGTTTRGCCGGKTVFDKRWEVCCLNSAVFPSNTDTACCGKIAYDVRKYLCEDGKLLGYHEDTCASGRSVVVHLFNWKWTDVAAECERYLGPAGFCGVQVSPPNEHAIIQNPQRPWYERYQPISYKLSSRSGSEEEFRQMVRRCNAVKVRIYVDVVINHMCGYGIGTGRGSAGTSFDSINMQFPAVPYGPTDFNCCNCNRCGTSSCNVENYGDQNQVRNCRLLSLLDLDLGKDSVREKITDYLNRLIAHGVAGFRVDSAKHMWPEDLEIIFSKLNNLNTSLGFEPGARPFIFMEVIDFGGEPIRSDEYAHLGGITEFKFSRDIGRAFSRDFHLSSFRSFPNGWGFLPSHNSIVFVDNHDNQRGRGGGGPSTLTFYNQRPYTLATIFTLAHSYGFARVISSYRWEGGPSANDWIGPPQNSDFTIKTVELYENGSCRGDWVCEHRWQALKNMVKFRNVVRYHSLTNWWDNGRHQVAFSRGDRGFIAINNELQQSLKRSLQTGLSAGSYCDVISGYLDNNSCTGKTIIVGDDGQAQIEILETQEIPAVAIHAESKLGPKAKPAASISQQLTGFQRTVILIQVQTTSGQDVFLRGGISHSRRSGCTTDASSSRCGIPIRHRDVGLSGHYKAYNAWKSGDQSLDWYGREQNQGSFKDQQAEGTPTFWTTNQRNNPEAYKEINKFGENYWMLDVDMDCGATESGWFEFKAFVSGSSGWESNIWQERECVGSAGGKKPYASKNHMARCGYTNVFRFGNNQCIINVL